MNHNHIAVIGIGNYYPGAKNPKELWRNILARRQQFRRMPDQRLPLSEYYDENQTSPDKTYLDYAAVIDDFQFDWSSKRIPKSTYESTDIVHWLALEIANQALEDANLVKESIPKDKTGVIVGNSLTGEFMRSYTMRLRWPFVKKVLRATGKQQGISTRLLSKLEEDMEKIYKSVFVPVTEDTLAGNLSNTIAGRICNFFDFHGGGYVVDGACSSSLLAVATAADKLVNGDLDLAIAGGVDISLDPLEIIGFAKTKALTDKEMNVFDQFSSGFIPGEGSGFIILKRLEDARRDGDYVYGILRGWGISSDGKGGITAPKVNGQALALKRAYDMAGYSPHDLDFIEAHGTGTTVGDRIELEAIATVIEMFGTPTKRSCGVTSFKSLVGHTKAAAGIGGLIKAILAVNQRVMVPTAGCKVPNVVFEKKAQVLYPILEGEIFSPERVMKAGVSAMGFGGINCHVTLESGDLPKEDLKTEIRESRLLVSPQETELFIFTGDTQDDLRRKIKQASDLSIGMSISELSDYAHYLIRDIHKKAKYRVAIIANHPKQLTDRLNKLQLILTKERLEPNNPIYDIENQTWISYQNDTVSKLGFLFPGQGSQFVNMGRILIQRFDWAKEIADEAWNHMPESEKIVFRKLDKAIDQEERRKWEAELRRTEYSQITICLASVLWFEYLKRLGINPSIVAGHSLGELSALYVSGAYNASTLFHLAKIRGEAMAASTEDAGVMASLVCSQSKVNQLLSQIDGYVVIANINTEKQIVISGERAAVNQVVDLAKKEQIQTYLLPVSNAFHSKLVQNASDQLNNLSYLSENVPLHVPFVSGIDGTELYELKASEGTNYFAKQVISQVRFTDILDTLREKCDLLVEVGPGRVLTGLVHHDRSYPIDCIPVESSAGKTQDLQQLLALYFTQGGEVNWEVLYENRLVEPFVPAKNKHFIVNPVELPLQIDELPMHEANLSSQLTPFMVNDNELSSIELEEYLQRRGDFIFDVIRSDMKYQSQSINTDEINIAELAQTKEENYSQPNSLIEETKNEEFVENIPEFVYRVISQEAADITGYSLESISLKHHVLDDLNLDSIKSADFVTNVVQKFELNHSLDPTEYANATLEEIAHAIVSLRPQMIKKGDSSHDGLEKFIFTEVAKFTGFNEISLKMEHRLLDDLNLDSIKSAELLSQMVQIFELEEPIDITDYANAKLSEIVEIFQKTKAEPVIKQSISELNNTDITTDRSQAGKEQVDIQNTPSHEKTKEEVQAMTVVQASELENKPIKTENWVRDFRLDYLELSRSNHQVVLEDTTRFLIVTDQLRNTLASEIENELSRYSVPTKIVTFLKLRESQVILKEVFSHIVVILPKTDLSNDISRTIDRLQSVIQPGKEHGYHVSITFIQYGGGKFGNDLNQVPLGGSTAKAFASSLHLERPDAKIRVIDLSPKLKAAEIAKAIIEEIADPNPFLAVGYDKNRVRYVPYAAVQNSNLYPSRGIIWNDQDVLLVTGGAKGITAECALGVAISTKAKFALVGSSAMENQPEVQRNVNRFREIGIQCEYYQCDITDIEQVAKLISQVETDLGTVTGFIHGAANLKSKRAEQVSKQGFLDEMSPKVIGARNILNALSEYSLKLIIGFSSLAGVTGMSGNSSYGFSNEMLRLMLKNYENKHSTTQTLTISFGVWDAVGMGTREGAINYLEKMGISTIPVKEGVERFVHLFHNHPQSSHVIVSSKINKMSTWKTEPINRPRLSFMSEIISDCPKIEVIARHHLDVSKDDFMKDHLYNNTYLFPAVFGLEAMAQAVSFVTGRKDFRNVRIQDIQFMVPIIVDKEKGTTIELRALALESGQIQVEIRSEATGFRKPHFSAVFLFEDDSSVDEEHVEFPKKDLQIDLINDFYKPMMFQGSLYHRLEKVYDTMFDPSHQSGKVLFAARSNFEQDYVLGDPYFHDAILQSARLITPQDLCLPVGISSFQKYDTLYMRGDFQAVTRFVKKEDHYYYFSISVIDQNRRVVQRISDFKVRIMEHFSTLPTANELASLSFTNENRIKIGFQPFAEFYSDINVPTLGIDYLPNIHHDSKEVRHQRIQSLFKRTIKKKGIPSSAKLSWMNTGKPYIEKENVDVSFSHDDDFAICVIGDHNQGCDILPIENRSIEQWLSIYPFDGVSLIKDLQDQGDTLSIAGSRIWTCFESAKKASGEAVRHIKILKRVGQVVELIAYSELSAYKVITIPVQLTLEIPRMVAFVIEVQKKEKEIMNVPQSTVDVSHQISNTFGYIDPNFGFVYRFPLIFEDSSTISRRVNFSSYSKWVGKVRELFIADIMEKVKEQVASGAWGMATNFNQTEVFGEAKSDDVIEAHFQLKSIQDESYVEFVCYWNKVLENGELELIAISRQGMTWVEIAGHGIIKKSPFPAYFRQFLEDRFTSSMKRKPARKSKSLSSDKLGEKLYEIKTTPDNRVILQEKVFETSLEDSNLVGNIYFSNYTVWQGVLRDQYFYHLAPELYKGIGDQGEWITISNDIQHLREAMPFDTILVEMSLAERYEYGIKLYFDYFKLDSNGTRRKLSFGIQQVVWMKRDEHGNPHPAAIPREISMKLDKSKFY